MAFLRHRGFPMGPVLLRDLLGTAAGREQKAGRIQEILDLHPKLPFVLIGDSGEKDPEIYADIVRAYPDRVLAVYIREVRLDPGDGQVEKVSSRWAHDVPFVLAPDSDAYGGTLSRSVSSEPWHQTRCVWCRSCDVSGREHGLGRYPPRIVVSDRPARTDPRRRDLDTITGDHCPRCGTAFAVAGCPR